MFKSIGRGKCDNGSPAMSAVSSPPPRALLSVYDKTDIVSFAKGLVELGFELVSTGGTARTLSQAGLPVMSVSDLTQHPEIFSSSVAISASMNCVF